MSIFILVYNLGKNEGYNILYMYNKEHLFWESRPGNSLYIYIYM